MTFLWLCRQPPYPPLRGGDVEYSRELIHSLARHTPTQGLAFAEDGVEPPADAPLPWVTVPYKKKSKIASLASPLPDVAFRFQQQRYLDRAIEMARDADAIFVDFIGMAWLVKPLHDALKAGRGHAPIIMVTHNHEYAMRREHARASPFPMRLALTLDAEKAGRLERSANRIADGISAITPEDAAVLTRDCKTPVEVILPGYDGPRRPTRRIDAATPRVACILGGRRSTHKVAVLEHSLAALARHGADRAVTVEIGGDGDLDHIARQYPDIVFKGFVEDLVSYSNGIRLGLIPDDIGGGFKIRVLSHVFLRMPILGLHSAMAGTGLRSGEHFVGVDTLDELAERLPTLMDDVETLDAMQNAAYAYCEARYDWADRGATLAAFAQKLMDR